METKGFDLLFICIAMAVGSYIVAMIVSSWIRLPDEKGKSPILTVYPWSTVIAGDWLNYIGPFSRISLYPDFLVIRVLIGSRVLKKEDFTEPVKLQYGRIIMYTKQNGHTKIIKVYVIKQNKVLFSKIKEWQGAPPMSQ